jgi:tetratricopeptide (TPR) repeat protein
MAEGPEVRSASVWRAPAAILVIGLAVILAYSNVPGNTFAFDDAHCIENNPWLRSLSNIPRYFVDVRTATPLWTNADYRPVLAASFAANYAMSGAVINDQHPDSWHWTNILIHGVNASCIFLLGRRLFGSRALVPMPGLSPNAGDAAAFAAALLFAVHPVTAGCVNYISSRSTSLIAMFLLLALLCYLAGLAQPRRWWNFLASGILFILALLTKIEAVCFMGVILLAELLLVPDVQQRGILSRIAHKRAIARFIPFALAGIALVILWRSKTAVVNPTRGGTGISSLDYLATEFRAWWYYLGKLFFPVNQIADYPTFPRSTWSDVIHLRDTRPLIALLGWIIIAAAALIPARRAPSITFLALCFFIYLAPHSSIIPLYEPVNEHRPYLPNSAMILLLAAAAAWLLSRVSRRPAIPLFLTTAVLLAALIPLTRARNRVWHDPLSLWGDTVAKAPDSERAHVSYAEALITAGRLDEAETHCRQALQLAPDSMYAFLTLANILTLRGNIAAAMAAHNDAIRALPVSDAAYYARGQFRAQLRDVPGAADDLTRAVRYSGAPFKELAGAAECLLRLGRDDEARPYIARGQSMDAAGFDAARQSFRALLGAPDPMEQVADGVTWMSQNRLFEAEWCFKEALRMDPRNTPAESFMSDLLNSQGQAAESAKWFQRAIGEHRGSSEPYYIRGWLHASRREWDSALADLRTAQTLAPDSPRESAALIETLIAAGKSDDADAELAKITPLNRPALSRERADFHESIQTRK